ncbi:ABC transporter substrate-binding protein [Desulfobacula sp.]|uniref:ABC transporter substrate-binding protein n=1 Tax=Desulfobacula sp. TaxID=2593537 RepID=UPI00261E9CB3|nr:ABC transporter substrate-binding protein [Desulfobacula sp.]
MKRREFLIRTAGTVGAMGMGAFPSILRAEPSTKLRVGYLPITDATPLLMAHALGYFQEEGLNVERPIRVRSWSTLMESFLSGKFNVTHMLLPIPIWMRFKNRVPVKVLAWNHTNGSALTVRGDSNIHSFADLGGHQIAIPNWYSIHNIILQMGLRKFGLKPVIQPQSVKLKPNEVSLFVLSPPEMPAALTGRKIDGYIVAEPFNAISEIKTGARIMRFTGDIWKNHPCCVVVMHERYTTQNPIFTQKVINAIVRAQLWVTSHPHQTAHILSREGKNYLPIPKKILLRAFTGYDLAQYGKKQTSHAIHHPEWNIGRIGFQPWPYPSASRMIIREMQQTLMEGDANFLNRLNIESAAMDLVDDRFVRQAIIALGGQQLFQGPGGGSGTWEREEIIEI